MDPGGTPMFKRTEVGPNGKTHKEDLNERRKMGGVKTSRKQGSSRGDSVKYSRED